MPVSDTTALQAQLVLAYSTSPLVVRTSGMRALEPHLGELVLCNPACVGALAHGISASIIWLMLAATAVRANATMSERDHDL